jgi:pentatricopeptide repeat protein
MVTMGANVMQVLADVETELVFFTLAIATHLLFFHKWGKGHPYSMFFNRQPATSPKGQEFSKSHLPKPTATNTLLAAFKAALRSSDVKSAMSYFEELHGLDGDGSPSAAPQMLLEQLVKLAVQKGMQQELLQLLAKMDLSASALDLMLAESTGESQEIGKLLAKMQAEGVKPSTTSFNKLLSGATGSNADAAWALVNKMKSAGVKPDHVTCTILLKHRYINSQASNLEKVIAITSSLEGDMDEVLFNSIVDACIRVGRADLMMPFLKKERNSKRPTLKNPRTYSNIIRAYGLAQDINGAWETWNEMRRQHIAPINITLGCMVEALVTNGDIEGGYELVHSMLEDGKTAGLVNAVMYGSIVKGFSHKKDFDRMWQVYDEMVAQKLQFSMVTYNTLIDACARSGELCRIPSLLKDIQAQGLKMGLVTYSAIIKGYCVKNMFDEAFDLFSDMVKNTDLKPDEIMYNTLLDGCARKGMYDRGMDVFDMMQKTDVRPTNYTLSVLVKLANRGKKIERAFEFCEELSRKYSFRLNVHVFDNLIQACINHRDLPRGLDVLARMVEEHTRPDVRSYSLLLRAFIDARQGNDAAGLLRAATGVSGKHPWNGPHQRLAKLSATALKPQGGLPGDLISEILTGIIDMCHDERLASSLLLDLSSKLPDLKLDPKLRLRLAARMSALR